MKRGNKHIRKALRTYGGFLSKSWKTTRSHKQLWLIAAVAGLANTGAIFNRVMNRLWQIQPADKVSIDTVGQAVESVPWVYEYFKATLTLDPIRITLILFCVILLFAAASLLVIAAQQIVLHHSSKAARSKKYFTLDHLKKDLSHTHVFRIFAIDALMFLSIALLQLLAMFPLAFLLSNSLILNAFLFVGIYLILLPLGFIVNAVGMFTLINIIRKDLGIVESMKRSWLLLKNHWVVIFELALILYIINILVVVLIKVALVVIAVPLGLLTFASLGSGSVWLMMLLTILGVLFAVVLVALLAGAMTMFNYSVWTHLLNRFDRYPFVSCLEVLAEKVFLR